jgi:hypothetical protein
VFVNLADRLEYINWYGQWRLAESIPGFEKFEPVKPMPICKAILKAFKDSEYLNIADFRLLAKGGDSQTLTAAIDYLIENEYMVALDADCYDDYGNGQCRDDLRPHSAHR